MIFACGWAARTHPRVCENRVFFACGCLCRPHGKNKIQFFSKMNRKCRLPPPLLSSLSPRLNVVVKRGLLPPARAARPPDLPPAASVPPGRHPASRPPTTTPPILSDPGGRKGGREPDPQGRWPHGSDSSGRNAADASLHRSGREKEGREGGSGSHVGEGWAGFAGMAATLDLQDAPPPSPLMRRPAVRRG